MQPSPTNAGGPREAGSEAALAVGGAEEWSPYVMPTRGIDLTPEQTLAASFRVLAAVGFSENIAGHITVADEETGNLAVNPWGLWWEEVRASDICTVTPQGEVIAGPWDVTPAIHIHTELHRAREDARVVVHNHPYHATVLAALGVLPDFFHQTGCLYADQLAFVDEYAGEVASPELGADLASRIGDASVVLLANHGIIVTAPTVEEATYKAASIDRQCRLAYDVHVGAFSLGRTPTTVAEAVRRPMRASLLERATDVFWNGWVRKLVREQPEFLL